MKHNKSLSLVLLSSLLLLAGCHINPTNNSKDSTQVSPSGDPSANESTSSHRHVDYINDPSVRLNLDYTGKSFWTDGVEQVTSGTPIDGDTVHFKTSTGELEKARFYGIDTPESTGAVEDWGEDAHRFTRDKVEEAFKNGTVVISSPRTDYGEPTPDSTGTRYVTLVWINLTVKNAPLDQLVLLNLWIVQEGLSYVKNVASIPAYSDTFYAAEAQAREEKLALFSGTHSQYYNSGDYIDTSLLDIKKEIIASNKDSSHTNAYDNQKVRIVGTVAGFSNHILYLQNFYSADQGGRYSYGEYAGINIFTGMGSISSKYTAVNTYIQICGLCKDDENFGFQMTDTQFQAYPKDSDTKNARVKIAAKDNTDEFKLYTFTKKASEVYAARDEILNCSVELSDTVKVTGGYYNEDKNYCTLYVTDSNNQNVNFSVFVPFIYHPTSDTTKTYKLDDFTGKTFNLKGVFASRKSSTGKIYYQIIPNDASDFTEVTA